MIEPTEDMIQAFWSGASWPSPGDLDVRRGLAAVLAVVERDRCMEPSGHVWHPLKRPVVASCCIGYGSCAHLPGCEATT